MFAAQVFVTLLAVASPLLVSADMTPVAPGPGDVFNAGSPCTIKWTGDTNSTTAWKDMAIELMTGSDLDQIHITTVANNQDGSQDGTFSYTCPEVTINAAIYFYQFSAAATPDLAWTTRFTIASDSGATVSPPNATQPSGKAIPWGIGALVDPSTAVAAPIRGTTSGNSTTTSAAPVVSVTASSSITKLVTSASAQSLAASSTSGSASGSAASAKATSPASTFGVDGRVVTVAALVAATFLW